MRVLALLLASTLAAQQPAEDSVNLDDPRMVDIRLKMAENLNTLPNYTCLETIERSLRRANNRRFQLIDTLRLEVALVGGKEMFSWPGARNFEDRELRDMVGRGGAIGTGSFGLHAKAVFLSGSARYSYQGIVDHNGRRAHLYHYRVPQFLSGYTLRVEAREALVGYHGSFWMDAETLDLIRLEVIADDIPPILELSAADNYIDYHRAPIGEQTFLLPSASEIVMTDLDQNVSRNRTSFSDCRQWAGESVISFAEAPTEPAPEPPPPPRIITLPEKLVLDLRLDQAITPGKQVVGDPVTATVGSDAKQRGTVIVPKGAVARGRIVAINRQYQRGEMMAVTIEFEELEFEGARADLTLALNEVTSLPGHGRATALAPDPEHPGQGTILLSGMSTIELRKGIRMFWVVESNRNGERQ